MTEIDFLIYGYFIIFKSIRFNIVINSINILLILLIISNWTINLISFLIFDFKIFSKIIQIGRFKFLIF